MSARILSTLIMAALLLGGFALAEDEKAPRLAPPSLLVLGPLPMPPEPVAAPFPRGEHQAVLEIEPGKVLPNPGDPVSLVPGQELRWEMVSGDDQGQLEAGIYWVTAVLQVPRRMEVHFHLAGGEALFLDGEDLKGSSVEGELTASKTLRAGCYTVQGRAVDAVNLAASWESDGWGGLWSLENQATLVDFGYLAGQPRVRNLAISDDGHFIVRRLARREPAVSRLDVMDGKGRILHSDLGGGKSSPLGFFPDGHDLLLRRGSDLQVWNADLGTVRTILRDEPGLGFVKMSPDGKFLLFASSAGLDPADPPAGNRRYEHLREQLQDFTPEPHLHLLEVATGSRRQLTAPADLVLDDAVFSADGRFVYHIHTVSQKIRPWFRSQILQLDLATGASEKLAEFTGGWEVRPQGLAASPDGEHLVFLGPPDQVGGGRPERNVYNKQVWVLDLKSRDFRRVTVDSDLSYDLGGGLPRFDRRGHLLVEATRGSRRVLARLNPGRQWAVELMELQGGSLGALAVSPDGDRVVYSASEFDSPAALYQGKVSGKGSLLEDFAADWSGRWVWSKPEPANFTSHDGTEIEAWFYPPVGFAEGHRPMAGVFSESKSPLVVYYYAGSTPSMQGFNGTHQFFAANGYGVLVVNPRGAYGYGDEFADHHAGDWGPVAAGGHHGRHRGHSGSLLLARP
jgi:dipeptidyl aminopeptidase/acylaminoacyl peptidase